MLFCVSVLANEKIYTYHKHDGSVVFSNIKPNAEKIVSTLKFDCYACTKDSSVDWHNTPLFLGKYLSEITQASQQYAVEQAFIQAVIHAESSYRSGALSKVGAQGLMQLMPTTAKELGVNNPFNSKENILAGTRYMAKLIKLFNGDLKLAAAAYNAGASTVKQHGGIPPFEETQAYVKRVNILYKRYYIASL